MWDAETGERLRELTGHRGRVWSVDFSPDGRRIASGSDDWTVAVWDAQTGERVTILALDGEIASVAWHPHGRALAAGDNGGDVYLLECREP